MTSPLRFLHHLPCGTSSPSHRAVYRTWCESDRRIVAAYSAMTVGRRTIFGAASTSTSSFAAEAARYRLVRSLAMEEGDDDDGRRNAIRLSRASAAASLIVSPTRRHYHISARAHRAIADDADGGVSDGRSNSRGGDVDDDGEVGIVDVDRGDLASSPSSAESEKTTATTTTMNHRTSFVDVPGATNTKSDKMVVVYTCKVCDTRSARQITKHAYDNGVVLIRCPGCNNLHLIADRLGWFEEKGADGRGWDVERLVEEAGENVRAVSSGDGILELSMEDIVGLPTKKDDT